MTLVRETYCLYFTINDSSGDNELKSWERWPAGVTDPQCPLSEWLIAAYSRTDYLEAWVSSLFLLLRRIHVNSDLGPWKLQCLMLLRSAAFSFPLTGGYPVPFRSAVGKKWHGDFKNNPSPIPNVTEAMPWESNSVYLSTDLLLSWIHLLISMYVE